VQRIFNWNTSAAGRQLGMIALSQRKPQPRSTANTTVSEIFALLGCYAARSRNYLPTFLDKLSVSSSRAKQTKNNSDRLTLEDGTESFLETSVNNYQSIRNIAEEGKYHLHGGGSLKFAFNIYTNADLEEMINAINHYIIQHQSVIIKAFFTRRN